VARILIIEDDDLLRTLLAQTLTEAGHTVYQAADGRQGCDLFLATAADLVLTDIIMPGQEGIETILKLRHQRPTVAIIAMSGGATHSRFYLDIAAKLGAHRILAKPFLPADLLKLIDEVLAEKTPPPASPPHEISPP
jgi:DNA-binding response OmpR family regulator